MRELHITDKRLVSH